MNFIHFKKYASVYPMFCHEILSMDGEGTVSKGNTVTSFLKNAGPYYHRKAQNPDYYPKVITLVNDKKKHLENVEESLKAYNPSIQFIGIEYKGAFTSSPQDISKENLQKFWKG